MYKPLADSTLHSMTKKEIIELLRIAEHNAKASLDWTLIGDAADAACRVIDSAPTVDAVVVTRCKNCKYLVNATVNDNGFLICDVSDMEIAPEDFCSYGEPKEV